MPSYSESPRDPARRQRKRRTHQRIGSDAELLASQSRSRPRDSSERRERRRDESTGYNRQVDGDEEGTPSKQRPRQRSDRYDRRDRHSSHGRTNDYRERHESREKRSSNRSHHTRTTSTGLSTERLAQLDSLNEKLDRSAREQRRTSNSHGQKKPRERAREGGRDHDRVYHDRDEEDEAERQRQREERRKRRREQRRGSEAIGAGAGVAAAKYANKYDSDDPDDITYQKSRARRRERDRDRIPSGQRLEKGGSEIDRGEHKEKNKFWMWVRRKIDSDVGSSSSEVEYESEETRKRKKKRWLIGVPIFLIILIIIIVVGVVVSKKRRGAGGEDDGGDSKPNNSNLNGMSKSDIPQEYQGTYLDPFTWYDTKDFNVTFTSATVGGLSVMGLNDAWDDSTRANDQVPPLDQSWSYGQQQIRGINLGGWLSIEPFITPSLFKQFSAHDSVVDEYTLTSTLGPSKAASTLEKHYSSWINEQTFADIQAAGFDHVRIPFSYWAVTTYEGDPYVPRISWRYLLRGIEWARKYGLRINLDLHGAPGSQNGWNHSGRQGTIRWLNGTDGQLNGQRTIDIHDQLSTFFTQPRYKNIVTMYGLVNEPRMVQLDTPTVLAWSNKAIDKIRENNFTGIIVFGDGFMGLDNWQGKLQNINNLLLDVHQYVIFNVDQLVLNHHDKINFACGGWTAQALRSSNKATGFGPTLCGEWSQADTDCAQYLNNVGVGSRWEGTLNMASGLGGSTGGSVLTPTCPTKNNPRCSCDNANADPSTYSAVYKQWLLMFAEAQMHSFEQGWGWFYWTWKTESAPQWSYKDGLAAGILPKVAYRRSFNCSSEIPDFAGLGLAETY